MPTVTVTEAHRTTLVARVFERKRERCGDRDRPCHLCPDCGGLPISSCDARTLRKISDMSIPAPDVEPVLTVLPPDEALRVAKPVAPHPPAEPGDPTPEDWDRLEEVLRSET